MTVSAVLTYGFACHKASLLGQAGLIEGRSSNVLLVLNDKRQIILETGLLVTECVAITF